VITVNAADDGSSFLIVMVAVIILGVIIILLGMRYIMWLTRKDILEAEHRIIKQQELNTQIEMDEVNRVVKPVGPKATQVGAEV